jgi:hypothetical protein
LSGLEQPLEEASPLIPETVSGEAGPSWVALVRSTIGGDPNDIEQGPVRVMARGMFDLSCESMRNNPILLPALGEAHSRSQTHWQHWI